MSMRLKRITCDSIKPSAVLYKSNLAFVKPASRSFCESAQCQTRERKSMWMWMSTQGENFRDPLPGSTNYLGAYSVNGELRRVLRGATGKNREDQSGSTSANGNNSLPPETMNDLIPFPQNRAFRSERIANEAMREDIWEKVMKDGLSVKVVSAQLSVEMNRVGAIVRLKEIEKEWMRRGKRLARPYAKAVLAMLPQTAYPNKNNNRAQPHESINDLPVHVATMQQIFHPTSESREFTRADAARVFDEKLLPADQRVPHPELAELEKDRLAGVPYNERVAKATRRNGDAEQRKAAAEQRWKEWEEESVKVVSGPRWDFKFREINVNDAGVDGRGYNGTGWRYGAPHMDRRKGEVKIPTSVE